MLNMNSPTVQMMLSQTPQGFGNIPMGYGQMPTLETTYMPVQQSATPVSPSSIGACPYPSPKEMLTMQGQQAIYAPVGFGISYQYQPRNIVGGYNPGYQAAFAGYSNPFMGVGLYGGFGFQPQFLVPPDEESRMMLEAAQTNGVTYDEQLVNESTLCKTISRIVSKNLKRDKETADQCADAFSIYCKYPRQEMGGRRKVEPIHVRIMEGDTVVADVDSAKVPFVQEQYARNASMVEVMKVTSEQRKIAMINRNNYLYDHALERQFDNVDLLDFFNNCAGILMADSLNRRLQQQLVSRAGKMYNSDEFHRMLEKNGLRTKEQLKAADRFFGRYGVMPDGRPTTPGLDPSVASCFAYNPKTGSYEVTAPNFIRDRLEEGRQRFIRTIPGV